MRARSALFDLFGDHLRSRGGRAPIAALIRLLAPLDIAGPAVRTAVSRMVREGWLLPERLPTGRGYALSNRAAIRLDDAAARIYRTRSAIWDGRWHLLVLGAVPSRASRERLRAGLNFLGYAPLGVGESWSSTWIAARGSAEAEALLELEGITADRFTAEAADPASLIGRAWDLDELGRSYGRWLADATKLLAEDPASDERAYAVRSELVHGWRKFLFSDPGLPRTLLPDDWPGVRAASYFDAESRRLLPAASRFVDACLTGGRS